MSALMKSPSAKLEWLMVKPSREKSAFPMRAAISGVMRSFTRAFTTAVNAAPTTTATARSVTFPRARNARNPLNVETSFAAGERATERLRRQCLLTLDAGPSLSRGSADILKRNKRSYHTRVFFAQMDCPDNLDTFLRDLLKEEGGAVQLDDEDRAFIDRILKSITQGSKGVFVVLHPNDRMQYMLLNTNRAGAIALLAKVMQRTAEALEADLD